MALYEVVALFILIPLCSSKLLTSFIWPSLCWIWWRYWGVSSPHEVKPKRDSLGHNVKGVEMIDWLFIIRGVYQKSHLLNCGLHKFCCNYWIHCGIYGEIGLCICHSLALARNLCAQSWKRVPNNICSYHLPLQQLILLCLVIPLQSCRKMMAFSQWWVLTASKRQFESQNNAQLQN